MPKCLSCGRDVSVIDNSISFECPECGAELTRCGECRRLGVEYKCKCGFDGL